MDRTPEKRTQSVFASPPEPIFNESRNGISPVLLQETLQCLAKANDSAVESSQEDLSEGVFRSGNAAAFIFHLCHHLDLPAEVQYRAIEMFHCFMTKHIEELYNHVRNTQKTESPINWDTVEERLRHQVALRALTCVQLSSKLSLHYKIVSINKARAFLTNCGFRYAPTSLVQSEIRVLKTLDFKIHTPSPLDYIEVLLEIIGHHDSLSAVKQLHGVALKVLDAFYCCRCEVMKKLKECSSESVQREKKASVLEVDFMLLAASVLGASSFILDQSASDSIIDTVSRITCIVREDIIDFSAVLVEQVMYER